MREVVFTEADDNHLRLYWSDRHMSIQDVIRALRKTETDVRRRASQLDLGRRPNKTTGKKPAHVDIVSLRPRHVTAEHGSELWFEQCNNEYVRAMRRVHPEREVFIRCQT